MTSRHAHLIGAYGGEHLGDAAILGGVLLHLADRGEVSSTTLASFRPERTRRLVATIDLALPLEVVPHRLLGLDRGLWGADRVIWAGGPIADSPRLLARNLVTAALARARGTPFALEGVGIGPLRRRLSRTMARAILGMATSVAVRSSAAAAAVAELGGRSATVVPDPAFDYLASRRALTRISDQERDRIDQLASRSASTRLVCVNARPAQLPVRRPLVAGALERLAQALTRFARLHPTRYVFFPLETEGDTGPDLEAARVLSGQLPPEVDFQVWHERPGVDGTLGLLRHADAAVTMRLHAAVFALSQAVPTIGIDYYADESGPGKVSELFDDRGDRERVIPVAELEPERLARLLVEATAGAAGRREQR